MMGIKTPHRGGDVHDKSLFWDKGVMLKIAVQQRQIIQVENLWAETPGGLDARTIQKRRLGVRPCEPRNKHLQRIVAVAQARWAKERNEHGRSSPHPRGEQARRAGLARLALGHRPASNYTENVHSSMRL